jgi:hypothetical protein
MMAQLCFDLADQIQRATDSLRQRSLGQVERFAALFEPRPKRGRSIAISFAVTSARWKAAHGYEAGMVCTGFCSAYCTVKRFGF